MPLSVIDSILYILLGAVAGMIYSLRRVFILEKKIDDIDSKLFRLAKIIESEEKEELRLLKRKKRREKLLFVFHTWEVLSIILILGFFFQIFWLIFLGFFIHVLEDIYDYYTRVKIYSRRISLFFDM